MEFCLRQLDNLVKGQETNKTKPCMLKLLKKQMKTTGFKAATSICERCSNQVKIGVFNKNSEKSLTKNVKED